jgi:hypothetical protein
MDAGNVQGKSHSIWPEIRSVKVAKAPVHHHQFMLNINRCYSRLVASEALT